MQAHTLHTWIARRIAIRTRLAQVGVSYLLFLMVVTRKHSLEEAARFSGLHGLLTRFGFFEVNPLILLEIKMDMDP